MKGGPIEALLQISARAALALGVWREALESGGAAGNALWGRGGGCRGSRVGTASPLASPKKDRGPSSCSTRVFVVWPCVTQGGPHVAHRVPRRGWGGGVAWNAITRSWPMVAANNSTHRPLSAFA